MDKVGAKPIPGVSLSSPGHRGAAPMRETIDESVADGAPVILRFANCELDVARVSLAATVGR